MFSITKALMRREMGSKKNEIAKWAEKALEQNLIKGEPEEFFLPLSSSILSLSRCEDWLVTFDSDKTVKCYHLATRKMIWSLPYVATKNYQLHRLQVNKEGFVLIAELKNPNQEKNSYIQRIFNHGEELGSFYINNGLLSNIGLLTSIRMIGDRIFGLTVDDNNLTFCELNTKGICLRKLTVNINVIGLVEVECNDNYYVVWGRRSESNELPFLIFDLTTNQLLDVPKLLKDQPNDKISSVCIFKDKIYFALELNYIVSSYKVFNISFNRWEKEYPMKQLSHLSDVGGLLVNDDYIIHLVQLFETTRIFVTNKHSGESQLLKTSIYDNYQITTSSLGLQGNCLSILFGDNKSLERKLIDLQDFPLLKKDVTLTQYPIIRRSDIYLSFFGGKYVSFISSREIQDRLLVEDFTHVGTDERKPITSTSRFKV